MQSAIVRAICKIGIFIICAQTMVHFRPNSSYEKYLKMLVSIMILMQILQPLASILNGGQGYDLQERIAGFEEQVEESRRAAEQKRERTEEVRQQMSLEEVQRRLQDSEIAPVEEIRIGDGKGGEDGGGETEGDVEEIIPQG